MQNCNSTDNYKQKTLENECAPSVLLSLLSNVNSLSVFYNKISKSKTICETSDFHE